MTMTESDLPRGLGYPDIPGHQKRYFNESKLTNAFTIDQIRKMPIWAYGTWHQYYVLFAATQGGTSIDEDGFLPEGMKCIFIDKHTGAIRIAWGHAAVYFIDSLREELPSQAMDGVPFDNLKIG